MEFVMEYYETDQKYINKFQVDIKIFMQEIKDQTQIISNGFQGFKFQKKNRQDQKIIEENKNPQDTQIIENYHKLLKLKNLQSTAQNYFEFLQLSQIKGPDPSLEVQNQIKSFLEYYQNQEVIRSKIQQLEKDYDLCNPTFINKTMTKHQQVERAKHQQQRLRLKTNIALIHAKTNFDPQKYIFPIQFKDCHNQINSIQEFYHEQKKIIELFNYKLQMQSITSAIEILLENQKEVISNSKIIGQKINNVSLKKGFSENYQKILQLITSDVESIFIFEYRDAHMQKIKPWYQNSNDQEQLMNMRKFFKTIFLSYERIIGANNIILQLQQLIKIDDIYLNEINKLNNELEQYLTNNFNYDEENTNYNILLLQRDINICLFNLFDDVLDNIIVQKGTCEQKLYQIDMKFYQVQQARELNNFHKILQHYDIIWNDLSSIYPQISEAKTNLYKFSQNIQNKERLYQIQIIQYDLDSDDIELIKSYEKLLKLQTSLVNLLNGFQKASNFLYFSNIELASNLYKQIKTCVGQTSYINRYSNSKIQQQLSNFNSYQEQCQQLNNRQIQNVSNFSEKNNYYKFKTKFSTKAQKSQHNLPTEVEFSEINIKDTKLSQQCQEDLPDIVEDLIETLITLEVIKYQKFGKEKYNKLIEIVLQFKNDFLKQTENIFMSMEQLNLFQRLRFFNNFPKQSLDPELQQKFDDLHSFNDKLGHFAHYYQLSIDLLQFDQEDFNQLQENLNLINEYLLQQFNQKQNNLQQDEEEKELQELYQDYFDCTGKKFLQEFCLLQYEPVYLCQNNCINQQIHLSQISDDVKKEHKLINQESNNLDGQISF